MLISTQTFILRPDVRDELLAEFAKLIEASEAEEGCITFRVSADLWDPNIMVVYEEFDSVEAQKLQRQSPHHLAAVEAIAKLGEGAITVHSRGKYEATPLDWETLKPA